MIGHIENTKEVNGRGIGLDQLFATKLEKAIIALLDAFEYASDTKDPVWHFAIPIKRFLKLGIAETDLRWLVRKGFVQHAAEVTIKGDDGREFRSTGNLTFVARTCFVLTAEGASKFRSIQTPPLNAALESAARAESVRESAHKFNGRAAFRAHETERRIPSWDSDSRKLALDGQLVKWFKWPAMNQERVLNAFQEEGWPFKIDDPLPPQPEQDPKRRLSDTIKCLNRKQCCHLIHFRGNGTGDGVVWEIVHSEFEGLEND